MKTCPSCGEEKSAEEFGRHRGRSDGCTHACLECTRARVNRRYRENPGIRSTRLATEASKTVEVRMLTAAKTRAKAKGLLFSLELSDIKIPLHCPILGMLLKEGRGPRCESSPSLDRVIPALGYIPGNVQVISYRANRIKNDATPEELRAIADFLENLTLPIS